MPARLDSVLRVINLMVVIYLCFAHSDDLSWSDTVRLLREGLSPSFMYEGSRSLTKLMIVPGSKVYQLGCSSVSDMSNGAVDEVVIVTY